MMPRLSGEESIRAANQIAVGSGTLEADDRRELIASWTQATRLARPKPRTDPRRLAAAGIGVRSVKPRT